MTQHESNDQVTNLGIRYTEVVKDIRQHKGLTATERPTVKDFISYVRQVADSSAATHASIKAFDQSADGSWSCDLTRLTGPPGSLCGTPGPSDACLTWMHIFKVFLFYEEQLEWEKVTLPGIAVGECWCATAPSTPGCAQEGKCWPSCAAVVRTAQPGLEPEWCGPWPGCSEYNPPFHIPNDDIGGLTMTNISIFFACGCLAALGCLRAISGYKRRRGAKYEKVPVMDGVELAVDFGDDETENQAGKETVVPTSG